MTAALSPIRSYASVFDGLHGRFISPELCSLILEFVASRKDSCSYGCPMAPKGERRQHSQMRNRICCGCRVKPDKGHSSREGLGFRPSSHAALRVFVAVFRPVRGFFRDADAVFLALGAALAEDSNSILGCFEVRWWP